MRRLCTLYRVGLPPGAALQRDAIDLSPGSKVCVPGVGMTTVVGRVRASDSVRASSDSSDLPTSHKRHSAGLLFLCLSLSLAPQVANVLVQQDQSVSSDAKQLMTFAVAAIKATLSGFVLPQLSRRLNRRALWGGFPVTVSLMTAMLLFNGIIAPVLVVMLFDDRCLAEMLPWAEAEEAHITVSRTYCNYLDANGNFACPDASLPNDGYVTETLPFEFEYPTILSAECGGAIVQTYTPIIMTSLLLQGVLNPLLWLVLVESLRDMRSKHDWPWWRKVVKFMTPTLIWPPQDCDNNDDDEGNNAAPVIQAHLDMMYSKSVFGIAQVLAFGLVSPLVAVVGLLAMVTTSGVYLHFIGYHVVMMATTAGAQHQAIRMGEERASFVERRLELPDYAESAGLPVSCTVMLVLSVSVFVLTVFGATFQSITPWRVPLIVMMSSVVAVTCAGSLIRRRCGTFLPALASARDRNAIAMVRSGLGRPLLDEDNDAHADEASHDDT